MNVNKGEKQLGEFKILFLSLSLDQILNFAFTLWRITPQTLGRGVWAQKIFLSHQYLFFFKESESPTCPSSSYATYMRSLPFVPKEAHSSVGTQQLKLTLFQVEHLNVSGKQVISLLCNKKLVKCTGISLCNAVNLGFGLRVFTVYIKEITWLELSLNSLTSK